MSHAKKFSPPGRSKATQQRLKDIQRNYKGYAKDKYESLRDMYDERRGGYNVKIRKNGKAVDYFVKSKYKPEQGGLYAEYYNIAASAKDESELPDYFGAGAEIGKKFSDQKLFYKAYMDAISKYGKEENVRRSQAKPYQRASGKSTMPKRGKQINFENSTILTKAKKLGASLDDDVRLGRRTLLGG